MDYWPLRGDKHQTKTSFSTESTKHHNVKEFKKTLNLDKFWRVIKELLSVRAIK